MAVTKIMTGVGLRAFVSREQLRFKIHGRQFRLPRHLKAMSHLAGTEVPSVFDWSQGDKITYPMDGNDQYGDCYYAAVAHGSNNWTGYNGTENTFDVSQLERRYLQLSGGDNGLSDSDIMPEWKGGIIGPNGPRKILDEMTVDFSDKASWQESFWAGGGLIWTCSLLDDWLNQTSPNSLWDATSAVNPNAGHAMWLTGRRPDGTTDTRTWAIAPAIHVTDAGFRAADSEFIVAFSVDQFDSNGICKFTGMTWDEKRQWWQSRGGIDVGASPFGPPGPPVPPGPPLPPIPLPPVPPMPQTVNVTGIDAFVTGGVFGNQKHAVVFNNMGQVSIPAPPVPLPPPTPPGPPPTPPVDDTTEIVVPAGTESGMHPVTKAICEIISNVGVTYVAESGKLKVTRPGKLTPDQWAAIIAAIVQLLAILGPIIGGG